MTNSPMCFLGGTDATIGTFGDSFGAPGLMMYTPHATFHFSDALLWLLDPLGPLSAKFCALTEDLGAI